MESAPRANILLVDDEPDNLLALTQLLESLGQNLVQARSGEEALRWVLKQDFAVILLDVRMPGMDGFETAAVIRQRKRSHQTPIIFVSGVYHDAKWMLRGYEMGAVDYLTKPIVPEILRSKVSVFVALQRKARETAEAASRAKAELLADMSHEIRMPVNAIIGMTKRTLDTELSAEQREFLLVVKSSADALLKMINDVPDSSRIRASSTPRSRSS